MDPYGYARIFNAAVTSGDWSALVDQFTDDATLEFVGPPMGPFVGRQAIADAYAQTPPDDTIEIVGTAELDGEELVVPFRWQTTAATGTMRFTEGANGVHRLVVTFD